MNSIMNYISYTFYFQSNINLISKCYGITIDIKKVDKQLTHAMHVKDRHVNDTFIDKFTKWYQ